VQNWFDAAQILVEQPGIVIEVRVERIFANHPFPPVAYGDFDQLMGLSPDEGRLVVSIDPAASETELSTMGPARVERSPDAFVFSAENGRGGWVLPEFSVPEGERAWLHVDLDSDAAGMLAVYRRSEESGEWLRRDAAYLPYGRGRESRTIALPGPPGTRAVRLHLFNAPASVRIRLVEVRATRP
jgi:hypothetical protein